MASTAIRSARVHRSLIRSSGRWRITAGRTKTHALLHGSPAIDGGRNELASGHLFDQRGQPRLDDGNLDGLVAADIGAYESGADEYFTSFGA